MSKLGSFCTSELFSAAIERFLFCSIEECVERLLASNCRPLFVAVKLEQFGQRSPHRFMGTLLREGRLRPCLSGLNHHAGSLDHGDRDPPVLRKIELGMCSSTSALKGNISGVAGDPPC